MTVKDVERGLIAAVINEGKIGAAVEAGITPAFFAPDEAHIVNGVPALAINAQVWEWCLDFWHKHGATPSESALHRNFPAYKLPDPDDPLSWYTNEMREMYRGRKLDVAMTYAVDLLNEHDTPGAMNALAVVLSEIHIATPSSHDVMIPAAAPAWALDKSTTYRDPRALRGITTGFERIDLITSGWRRKQFITVIGKAKTYKSWMMVRFLKAAIDYGVRSLFMGFEMTNDEQFERLLALEARIPYATMVSGAFTKDQRASLIKAGKKYSEYQDAVLSTDIDTGMTVSGIAAKIQQYKPHIVFVDGVYLMEDEHGETKGSSQALTNITRDFKRLAQRSDIPIIGSTQVLSWKVSKKGGITADAIGYSSSFAQDSDMIFGTERGDDENPDLFKVKCVLSRSCPQFETTVMWDWETTSMAELVPTDTKISDDEAA